MLLRGETAQGHVQASMVLEPHPLGGEFLKLLSAGPILVR